MLLNAADEGCCSACSHNAGDDTLVNVIDDVHFEHDVGHLLPCATVSTFFEPLIVMFLVTAIAIKPAGIVLNEVDDTLVEFLSCSPVEPLLYGRPELIDVEAADERRVKVGKLILVAIVHG